MNAQNTYESNMRVIGYLYNNIKDNYGTMQLEDFNELSGQISRLFQQSSELLPSSNRAIETEMEMEMETEFRNSLFDTPPQAEQSLNPPPIVRNQSQSNVTMTRGENVIDLSLQDELPMTLAELDDVYDSSDDDSSNYIIESSDEYQDYIGYKNKPKLTTKCFSKKEGREKVIECSICFEEHTLHQTLTLNCDHEFCKECVCNHFHFSVENQPYKKFYGCPNCRTDVKQVRVNYSKIDAKDKGELMAGQLVTQLKHWCK